MLSLNTLLKEKLLEKTSIYPRAPLDDELGKKTNTCIPDFNFSFFNIQINPKNWCNKGGFLGISHEFLVKGFMSMMIIESIWHNQMLTYNLYAWVVFPYWKSFVEDVMFALVEKNHDCISGICIGQLLNMFDFWMWKRAHAIFVVNFVLNHWEAKYVTIWMFKVMDV